MIDPQLFTTLLSLATIAGDLVIALLLLVLIFRNGEWSKKILSVAGEYGMFLAFGVALSALVGSLWYSNIIGYVPCNLCWVQRIFMYPKVVLLGMALWKRDESIIDYSIALSAIGGVIAFYHTYLQFGGNPLAPCSADVAGGVSCAYHYFVAYGYVTIPTMALTAFGLMALFVLIHRSWVFTRGSLTR